MLQLRLLRSNDNQLQQHLTPTHHFLAKEKEWGKRRQTRKHGIAMKQRRAVTSIGQAMETQTLTVFQEHKIIQVTKENNSSVA